MAKKENLLIGKSSLDPVFQKLYNRIYKAVMKMESGFLLTLSKYGITSIDDAQQLAMKINEIFYPMLMVDHPEIFWIDITKNRFEALGSVMRVHIGYNVTKAERDAILQEMTERVDEVLTLYKGKSDFDFAVAAMEWLDSHTYYDHSISGMISGASHYFKNNSAYAVFTKGASVCFGYASAYSMIMNKRGIPCLTVLGNSKTQGEAGHAWNIAKIDGEWCHIDCTFCDYNGRLGDDINVETNYSFFGLTDEQVTHYYEKDLLYAKNLPRCTSTKNNYFIRKKLNFSGNQLSEIVDSLFGSIESNPNVFGKRSFQVLIDRPKYNEAVLVASLVYNTGVDDFQKQLENVMKGKYKSSNEQIVPWASIVELRSNRYFPVITFIVNVERALNPFLLSKEELDKLIRSNNNTGNTAKAEKKPAAPVQKPVVPAEKPAAPVQKPVVPAEKPAASVQKPVVPAEKPVAPVQKPVVPAEKPAASISKTAETSDSTPRGVKYSEKYLPSGIRERMKQHEKDDPLTKLVAIVEIPSKQPFNIDGDKFIVGAGSKSDLCVYTTAVEECFLIYCDNGVWKIENRSKRKGHVYLNGKEVTTVLPLHENALIRVTDSKSYRFTTDLDNWFAENDPTIAQREKKPAVTRVTVETMTSYLYTIPNQEEFVVRALGSYIGNGDDCDIHIKSSTIEKIAKVYYDEKTLSWKIKNICGAANIVFVSGNELKDEKEIEEYDLIKIAGENIAYRFIINNEEYLNRIR